MAIKQNPYLQPDINRLRGTTYGLGFAGKEAKRFLKKFRTGNFDEYLAPEVAAGAKRKQEIEQGYGMGSMALAAANSGDASGYYQALKDRALAASDQQTGFDSINKMDALYSTALGAGQNAINSRRNAELTRDQMILQAINQGTYHTQNPIWGLLGAGLGAAGNIFHGAAKI